VVTIKRVYVGRRLAERQPATLATYISSLQGAKKMCILTANQEQRR